MGFLDGVKKGIARNSDPLEKIRGQMPPGQFASAPPEVVSHLSKLLKEAPAGERPLGLAHPRWAAAPETDDATERLMSLMGNLEAHPGWLEEGDPKPREEALSGKGRWALDVIPTQAGTYAVYVGDYAPGKACAQALAARLRPVPGAPLDVCVTTQASPAVKIDALSNGEMASLECGGARPREPRAEPFALEAAAKSALKELDGALVAYRAEADLAGKANVVIAVSFAKGADVKGALRELDGKLSAWTGEGAVLSVVKESAPMDVVSGHVLLHADVAEFWRSPSAGPKGFR